MISLYDILEAANGQLFGEPGAQLFTNFCVDALRAEPSTLFVAVNGGRRDDHRAMREAVERGATGLLATQPPEFNTEGLSVILVKDPLAAIMNWSHYMLGRHKVQMIGIAGSSDKTTVVEAVRRVLATSRAVLASSGEETGRLCIPMTLARLTNETELVVIELAANQPGEMAEMVGAMRPHAGVITQLGFGGSERFETPDQLAEESALLLEYLSPGGLAVLNHDDDRVRALRARTRAHVLTVGIEGFGADLVAHNIVLGPTRTGFDLRIDDQRFVGRWTPLLGRHALYSVMAALAVGLHFGIPVEAGLRALSELQPLPGRMRPFNGVNGCLLIDDSCDADPESALAALDWLQTVSAGRRRAVFVLGDMENLGAGSLRGHRLVGQRAAEFASLFITEGSDAAQAGRAAIDHGMSSAAVVMTHSTQDTIARLFADGGLTADDVVLVKGGMMARMELVTRALLANPADAAHLPRAHLLAGSVDVGHFPQSTRSSWIEIDLDALAVNTQKLRALIGPRATLFAVVKADGYGHGAVGVARTALQNGADSLAVASLAEALELREAGIEAPVLVMSYLPVQGVRLALRHDITATIYDLDQAYAYDRAAREAGGRLRVHVKIDTGMGRLGILASEAVAAFRSLITLNALAIEGIYTHFSSADADPDYTAWQVDVFKQVLVPLRAGGLSFEVIHAANSAGTLASAENHLGGVRVGLALYGLSPFEQQPLPAGFRPALSWKTTIAQVKVLPAGHPIGYGNTYVTERPERVAVIPVGYADGLRRAPQHWGGVLVHGQFAPIRGRVSMEKTVISVDHIDGAAPGDEVVLIGEQGGARITADEIAARLGTISYEVLCSVLPRVPRR